MRKVFFISCTKRKQDDCTTAKELYSSSDLFRKHMAYAEMKAEADDIIFILSAKYGLLRLDDVISPYDLTLNKMKKAERTEWAKKVLEQLKGKVDFEHDQAVFLTGKPYYQDLRDSFTISPNIPGEGLKIGNRLSFFGNELVPKNQCNEIHQLVRTLKRYRFQVRDSGLPEDDIHILSEKDKLPENGIYVLFEKGEIAHQGDRIVRIGTHTGQGRLAKRLKEHFIKENKDRSIFRKNIGRALLARDNDPFLEQWNWDLTTKVNKDKYFHKLDATLKKEVEMRVSQYMRDAFSFCIIAIPTPTKDERCRLEKFLIQTVSSCKECKHSNAWLGSYVKKLERSSLWLEQHTNSLPNGDICIETIKNYIDQSK